MSAAPHHKGKWRPPTRGPHLRSRLLGPRESCSAKPTSGSTSCMLGKGAQDGCQAAPLGGDVLMGERGASLTEKVQLSPVGTAAPAEATDSSGGHPLLPLPSPTPQPGHNLHGTATGPRVFPDRRLPVWVSASRSTSQKLRKYPPRPGLPAVPCATPARCQNATPGGCLERAAGMDPALWEGPPTASLGEPPDLLSHQL